MGAGCCVDRSDDVQKTPRPAEAKNSFREERRSARERREAFECASARSQQEASAEPEAEKDPGCSPSTSPEKKEREPASSARSGSVVLTQRSDAEQASVLAPSEPIYTERSVSEPIARQISSEIVAGDHVDASHAAALADAAVVDDSAAADEAENRRLVTSAAKQKAINALSQLYCQEGGGESAGAADSDGRPGMMGRSDTIRATVAEGDEPASRMDEVAGADESESADVDAQDLPRSASDRSSSVSSDVLGGSLQFPKELKHNSSLQIDCLGGSFTIPEGTESFSLATPAASAAVLPMRSGSFQWPDGVENFSLATPGSSVAVVPMPPSRRPSGDALEQSPRIDEVPAAIDDAGSASDVPSAGVTKTHEVTL